MLTERELNMLIGFARKEHRKRAKYRDQVIAKYGKDNDQAGALIASANGLNRLLEKLIKMKEG